MQSIEPTVFGFMVSCILAMGTFVVWLVKKILSTTKDCTLAMNDVNNSVKNNTEAIKNLKEILTINK